jgi:hypothetical protein
MHILVAIVALLLAGIFWRQIIAGLGLFLALGLAGAAVLAVVAKQRRVGTHGGLPRLGAISAGPVTEIGFSEAPTCSVQDSLRNSLGWSVALVAQLIGALRIDLGTGPTEGHEIKVEQPREFLLAQATLQECQDPFPDSLVARIQGPVEPSDGGA